MENRKSKILNADLPEEHQSRIQVLKNAGGTLMFHSRYLAGEHAAVWNELNALGEQVYYDPLAIDALAVAYETMDRALTNIRLLVTQLHTLRYAFNPMVMAPYYKNSQMAMEMWAFRESITLEALMDPHHTELLRQSDVQAISREENDRQRLKSEQERRRGVAHPIDHGSQLPRERIHRIAKAAGEMPISLRTWYKVIGGTNLTGSHPDISPIGVKSDALFVAPLDFVLDAFRAWEDDEWELGLPFQVPIAPDSEVKAGASPTTPMISIALPAPQMDFIIEAGAQQRTFVENLRHAFEWAGFPGYAELPGQPPELVRLLMARMLPI